MHHKAAYYLHSQLREYNVNTIISEQTIILGDQYDLIKSRIDEREVFRNLLEICRFNGEQGTLTFKTEKIHPEGTVKRDHTIMFLFSNPHPISVKMGYYFLEPQSRSFWQRLFECDHLSVPDNIKDSIINWGSSTPEILSECLLNCKYNNELRIFFDCLEALPTNQYRDLNKLFTGKLGQALRKQVLQDPGLQNLVDVSHQNDIHTWIVFSSEAYRYLVREIDTVKNAPERICRAIDDYLENNDKFNFWDSLKDLKRTMEYGTYTVTVYLTLIARRKNWNAKNGEKYFTVMLNQILDDILTHS